MKKLLSAVALVSMLAVPAASTAQEESTSYVQRIVEQASLRCRGSRCGRRGGCGIRRGGCQGGSCGARRGGCQGGRCAR